MRPIGGVQVQPTPHGLQSQEGQNRKGVGVAAQQSCCKAE
jgi:hypothetical protein